MKSFTYDKANQLVTSTADGNVTKYAYDAAGRLVKESDKMYSYGWLDKIVNVQENGTMVAAFDYHINGQIASATYADKTENFLWDGLALIQRSVRPTAELPAFGTGSRITNFINEPAITGGNPILSSNGDVMFNDMLGTTLAIKSDEQVNQVNMTAFGEPLRPAANGDAAKNQDAFFTGKPHIGELGYAFLFRNYRPEQGKWQTADPLGYPDGWNNLAYVNNWVTGCIDWLGTLVRHYVDSEGGLTVDDFTSGHSAWVVGDDSTGYTAYDYGPVLSGRENRTRQFNTLAEAEAFLQSGRTGNNKYDKAQDFTTTAAQDQSFRETANQFMTEGYDPQTHNCFQLGYNGLVNASVDIDLHPGYTPNRAYRVNNESGFAKPVTVRGE